MSNAYQIWGTKKNQSDSQFGTEDLYIYQYEYLPSLIHDAFMTWKWVPIVVRGKLFWNLIDQIINHKSTEVFVIDAIGFTQTIITLRQDIDTI